MPRDRTLTGLEILADDPRVVRGARVGLLTNYTGITPRWERNVDVLRARGVDIVVLLGPEHGLNGSAQAGFSEGAATDEASGLPVVDTYAMRKNLDQVLVEHRLDIVICDIQDIGVRYWTYVWTVYDAMVACARSGIRMIVLDRPNPLGGALAEGPRLDPRFSSFVGRTSVRQRHGLTLGELALLFNRQDMPRVAGQEAQVSVVCMNGWERHMSWGDTGQAWVLPSPNMPTLDSVYAFAALGLLEGTNVSEGRGTTRPFELFGAPYIDRRFTAALRERELPGVHFRDAWFRPTFHKYAGATLRGAQLHLTDHEAFRPVRTGLAVLEVLAGLYPDDFAVADRDIDDADGSTRPGLQVTALDRLWGSDSLRLALTHARAAGCLTAGGESDEVTQAYPTGTLLY